jgi:exonuclease SbcD
MRVLHTADWHLGAELKHVPRLPDQLARIDEILTICDSREVDLLLVAGDFIDETQTDRMTLMLRRLGELLRPRLERGMTVVIVAGNHDREWVFPFLRAAGDLFFEGHNSRVHFISKPELKVVHTATKEDRVRLLLLPYPRQTAYDLEAISFKDAADRHSQMAAAVKQRIKSFEAEVRKGPKMPTVIVSHLLIAGQKENGHELTEEADVPIPRVYLPNYAYAALGHVHQPTALGSTTCRYSGSIERTDFGEKGESKQVVLFELDSTGLVGEPEVIDLHPTDLRELEWNEGDDMLAVARGIPPETICKLILNVPVGTNVQALQAEARNLIARLCWPPDIHWQGGEETEMHAGSLALQRADWQGAVRAYVRDQVPEDDPYFKEISAAVEQLLAEDGTA